MALRDLIHIVHIGDDFFEDKESLLRKMIIQSKWTVKKRYRTGFLAFPLTPNNTHYLDPLQKRVFKECFKIYGIPICEGRTKSASYALVTNRLHNAYTWHTHEKSKYGYQPAFTVNESQHVFASSVYYYALPEGSGGIGFRKDDEEIELMPKEGDLIFFPSDMLHSPLGNTCTDWRVSININVVEKQDGFY
tara:strand:+ start:389 stop:961 length:573 start_codon:yes stop_codon:yes gene_type:complete